MNVKMSSAKCWPFCLGLNGLTLNITLEWLLSLWLIFSILNSNSFLNAIKTIRGQTRESILILHEIKSQRVLNETTRFVPSPWWRHQMETFSALLAICAGNSPVPGEFPTQRPVTRGFDVFFDLRLNKRLSKQSLGWWFETLSCPLWRHCYPKHTIWWGHTSPNPLTTRNTVV